MKMTSLVLLFLKSIIKRVRPMLSIKGSGVVSMGIELSVPNGVCDFVRMSI